MKYTIRSVMNRIILQRKRALLTGVLLGAFCPALLPTNCLSGDPQFTMIAGIDYAEQEYDWGEKTKIFTIPVILKYETDNWITRATLTSLQNVESESQNNVIERYSDLGDLVFGVAYKTSLQFLGENYFDLGVKVKIPSDDDDISDGKIDYMTQVDMFRSHGNWTPFAALGYRWRGDDQYQDGFYGTIGLGYEWNQTWSGGAMLDYNTSLYEEETDIVELIPYIAYRFSPEWKVRLYADTGLSDNSVDLGVGFQLIFQPGRKSVR